LLCHIYGKYAIINFVKEESVRTTVDIPRPLYRKLKEQAAARGFSIRELVLAGISTVLLQGQRPRSKRVRFPLIVSAGPKVNVTNEDIYEHVDCPSIKREVGPAVGAARAFGESQTMVRAGQ
jgi:hypothetical protein